MKHKTKELTGPQLDQAVALAEGWGLMPHGEGWCERREMRGVGDERIDCSVFHPRPLPWSTAWQQDGLIIERSRAFCCQAPDRIQEELGRGAWSATFLGRGIG